MSKPLLFEHTQDWVLSLKNLIITFAIECISSVSTSVSGSVSMAFNSSGQIKFHIWRRYWGPANDTDIQLITDNRKPHSC